VNVANPNQGLDVNQGRDVTEEIKVLFASGSEDRIPEAVEFMQKLAPELPLVVVSEFPVAGVRWIRYPVGRGFRENLSLFKWHFRRKTIRRCGVIWQPRTPHRRMRLIAYLLAPRSFVALTERFGPIRLQRGSLMKIVRHVLWRAKLETLTAIVHSCRWLAEATNRRRSLHMALANSAGLAAAALKAILPRRAIAPPPPEMRTRGVSVVIPSRSGAHLLAAVLPETVRQIRRIGGEIIVIDNGSEDGGAGWLAREYPEITLEFYAEPLSFARAVNAGLRRARFSHICLLNNDMVIEEGFFEALMAAFDKVPDLFCATAQIFFPEGARREETGKAVLPFAKDRKPDEFPLRCDLPLPGEDLSYVLYGSGGCSLFDASKLAALGGLDEVYQPAYVEDLDLGFRAWQQGWPSVFAAGARVLHQHRATTSRYYSREFLETIVELNYLRFLAGAVADARIFWRLWRDAIRRLNLLSAAGARTAPAVLGACWRAPFWLRRGARSTLHGEHILAIGSGTISVTPGRARRNRKMVLVATPYLPFPLAHGGAVRMFNLLRRAAQDFDVVLIAFASPPAEVPAELLEFCCEVVQVKHQGSHALPSTRQPDVVEEYASPAFRAALRQTIRKWKPGIVQLEYTQMAQYADDCAPAKTILVEHDITLDLYQQLLAQGDDWEVRRQLARWTRFETAAWGHVDCVITMSEKDRETVLSAGLAPARVVCLPNGVDLDRFQPCAGRAEPRRLLFIGSFAHLPNLLAVDFFLREAWPLLRHSGATFHIIAGERPHDYLERY
jgi:GT2 family glycosyltransferase